jgi:hypothetical protein
MKLIYAIAVVAAISLASCQTTKKEKTEPALGDTIQTASGLKYIYLKKGEGRKVEKGSRVGAYLSLMVEDKVVWNTNELPDSLFTYVADYSRVIKGFKEVTMYLREGDEIVAILADSIAYGAKGAGDVIPPHATLIYDQFKVVKVDAPKKYLSDELFTAVKSNGIEAAKETYEKITKGAEANQYLTDSEQTMRVWYQLTDEKADQLAADYAIAMGELTEDLFLKSKAVESFEKLNQKDKAIELLKDLLKNSPDNPQLQQKLKQLEGEK